MSWGGPQNDRRGGEIKRTDGERRVKGRGGGGGVPRPLILAHFHRDWVTRTVPTHTRTHSARHQGFPVKRSHSRKLAFYLTCVNLNQNVCYLLSGYIGIRAGRRSSFRLPVGRHVEEVPDKDSVIVGTADDLELVELEPEHSARMFLHADGLLLKQSFHDRCRSKLVTDWE